MSESDQRRFAQMMVDHGYKPVGVNNKPFWKERSIKAVWHRVNQPARALICAAIVMFLTAAIVSMW